MCRIAGFWEFAGHPGYDLEKTLVAMRDALSHGGPDDAGMYKAMRHDLFLGHRRLSVLDLSSAGHQPMRARNLVITYNGEVYNFRQIASELDSLGHRFSSGSDTEVVLKSFQEWGFDAVQRFRGMFAFALWDEDEQRLALCRDRVGVKPLYWYLHDDLFMFASELKAFFAHPRFVKDLDRDAVALYLQLGYIPAPHSIFKHVRKLEPGSFLVIDADQLIDQFPYWNIEKIWQQGNGKSRPRDGDLIDELENLLTESFSLRLVSDVPVGIFLSGGIDSSLVTTLLQKQSGTPLKTFTIGFEDTRYNEAAHAAKLAAYLGTEHTELYCTEQEFFNVVRRLPFLYDEPFGDSSAIPTYLVSRLAKSLVTVSLSADGGDEIFGGYTKYEAARSFYPKVRRLPPFLKKLLKKALTRTNPAFIERLAPHTPLLWRYKNIKDKVAKFGSALDAPDVLTFFARSGLYISDEGLQKLIGQEGTALPAYDVAPGERLVSLLGMIDIRTYLPDDLMVKVDRATMHVALEGREPFLDHYVIEAGLGLPDDLKLRNGQNKWALRQILKKHVPSEFLDRPKQGFEIPVGRWLKELLATDVRAMCEDRPFIEEFAFDRDLLVGYVQNFLDGKRFVSAHFIWFLYMLHQWYRAWLNPLSPGSVSGRMS